MALLTDIVRETAESFGLGNKAGALVAETIRIMFNPKTGGLAGFLEYFDQAGYDGLTRSWRMVDGAIKPLDGKQLESVVGTAAITEAGRNLGLANARVRTAMAFVVPQLTRFFAVGGAIPRTIPPAVEAFLASTEARLVAPSSKPLPRVAPAKSWWPGIWAIGVLVLLVMGGVTGYQIWKNHSKIQDLAANPRQIIAVESPAPPKSEPEPEPGKPMARLTIRNDEGRFEYSGVVSDAGMKANIVEQLLTFYGQPRLSGDLTVDPLVAVPGWLSRLDRVLPQLNVPGLDVRMEGNSVKLGGWLSEQDRESVLNSLKTALGPGFRIGYLRDEDTELAQEAHARTLAALTALPPGYQGQDLAAALNQWVILFPEGSAVFPDGDRAIVTRGAELMKTMLQPVILEIGGHTDNQGQPAANQKLSQDRAHAVRDAFVQAGVPTEMLQVNGYGSERPVASNDSPYGRFKNRRIEFKVTQLCDALHPCGLPEPVIAQPVAPVMPSSLTPVPVESSPEPSLTPAPGAVTGPVDPVTGQPLKVVKPKPKPKKPKPKPRVSDMDPGAEMERGSDAYPGSTTDVQKRNTSKTGSSATEAGKPAKPTVPKGGRWIPQEPKSAAPPAKSSEPKKPAATPTKPKPKPAPPKPVERRPAADSSQDLF